jgi:protein-disulfide isomerase
MTHRSFLTLLGSIFLFVAPGCAARDSSQPVSGIILGGSPDAPIRMEVFSDFECPGCRYFYTEVVLPVLQNYASKDKVCVIYHEFPLNQHTYALKAARYCEAAHLIGRDKALRVVDALFEHQDQWDKDGNIEKVLEAALSREDFLKLKENLARTEIDRTIDQGILLGKVREVNGTPTMFLQYPGGIQKVERLQDMPYAVLQGFFDRIVK